MKIMVSDHTLLLLITIMVLCTMLMHLRPVYHSERMRNPTIGKASTPISLFNDVSIVKAKIFRMQTSNGVNIC